jgi:folate-dependent phosphoribosylglycinamide formyltransferase PurN
MPKFKNIGIIAHDNYGAREIFSKICRDHPDLNITLFITTGLYYKKTPVQSIIKLLKEASFIFCFMRFAEGLLYQFRRDTLPRRAKALGVKTFYTADINSENSRKIMKENGIELLVSTFTMHILNKETINLPKYSTIGTHPSILPSYRGLEVFFWALANQERSSGVSVFFLDPKIDLGKVFLQETFDILKTETVESIYKKLTEICARLLSDGITLLKEDRKLTFFPDSPSASYYPMPTKQAFRKFLKSGHRWFGHT